MSRPDKEARESMDLLGVAPISRSVERLTAGVVDGVTSFLGRICNPAADEFGMLLRDRVGVWRKRNAVKIARVAEEMLTEANAPESLQAPPRLAFMALEQGSWIDDDHVQQMWAGLLASSCSPHGVDDSNLIFVDLLSQLTSAQARLVSHVCEKAEKAVNSIGLAYPSSFLLLPLHELLEVSAVTDVGRLDREIDHLHSLNLLGTAIDVDRPDPVDVTPTALALNLYVRAAGHSGSPSDYFGLRAAQRVKAFHRAKPR